MYSSVLEAPFVKGYVKMANEGYEDVGTKEMAVTFHTELNLKKLRV